MKLLPLRFIPLGLAAMLLVTVLWKSPAGHWLESTGSIFLLLVLALVFPYLCFIWLTTLMTPPTASISSSTSDEAINKRNQDLGTENSPSQDAGNIGNNIAANVASNLAGNIINSLTPNNPKKVNAIKVNAIIDGGDDSSTILMALPPKSENNGDSASKAAQAPLPEKETKNNPNRRNFFTGDTKIAKNKTKPESQEQTAPADHNIAGKEVLGETPAPAENASANPTSNNPKNRSMRIRYRGAWVDYD